jgi:hypothetical protein
VPTHVVRLSSAALALTENLGDVPTPHTFTVATSGAVIDAVRATVVPMVIRVVDADITPPIPTWARSASSVGWRLPDQ